jgi:predicted ATPase
VWWLELAAVTDPELVEWGVVTAVGVRPLPGETPLEAAICFLAGRKALVLLDNCEHLLERCAWMADALLHGCADLTIVATSREPLGVGGETVWRVPSLSLPTKGAREDISSLRQSDAVRLFIERATKVRPNFAVSNATVPQVAQICEDLDGIPLAIELAAARVRVLSVERIAAGLADRFRLLTGGARGALARQQTLRASVDWSYELLAEPERALLRRLGVFHGGFTLDACEHVVADELLDRYAVLDLLTSLVDKSLVLMEERGAQARYRLLETVRHYALERLAAAVETEDVRNRHLELFLDLANTTEPELLSEHAPDALELLDADAANLEAAIEWAAGTDPSGALRLCTALTLWWALRGLFAAGQSAFWVPAGRSTRRSPRSAAPSPPRPDAGHLASPGTTPKPWAGLPLAIAPNFRSMGDTCASPPHHPSPTLKPASSNIR